MVFRIMQFPRLKIMVLVSTFAVALASADAAELSADDKRFLAGYEKVRAALAADDLTAAQKAAVELGEQGTALSKSDKIDAARSEFAKLSQRAIELGRGQSGYFVVNCPMLRKDWLQTSTTISNPYAGKSMLECGVIRK